MLKVEMMLKHEGEVALFAEFTQILRRNRLAERGELTTETTEPRPADAPSVAATYGADEVKADAAVAAAAAEVLEEKSQIIGHISPEGSTIPDAHLIEAFQKFAASKPMPVLIQLLAEYGAKKVGEIAQERRAAFLEAVRV